jgi:hypothetical protein
MRTWLGCRTSLDPAERPDRELALHRILREALLDPLDRSAVPVITSPGGPEE